MHGADVRDFGLRVGEDQFLQPAGLLGSDRLLAQRVEQEAQLVGRVGVGRSWPFLRRHGPRDAFMQSFANP